VITDRLEVGEHEPRLAAGAIELPQPLRAVGLDPDDGEPVAVECRRCRTLGRHRGRELTLRRPGQLTRGVRAAIELEDVRLLAVAVAGEEQALTAGIEERLVVIALPGRDRGWHRRPHRRETGGKRHQVDVGAGRGRRSRGRLRANRRHGQHQAGE